MTDVTEGTRKRRADGDMVNDMVDENTAPIVEEDPPEIARLPHRKKIKFGSTIEIVFKSDGNRSIFVNAQNMATHSKYFDAILTNEMGMSEAQTRRIVWEDVSLEHFNTAMRLLEDPGYLNSLYEMNDDISETTVKDWEEYLTPILEAANVATPLFNRFQIDNGLALTMDMLKKCFEDVSARSIYNGTFLEAARMAYRESLSSSVVEYIEEWMMDGSWDWDQMIPFVRIGFDNNRPHIYSNFIDWLEESEWWSPDRNGGWKLEAHQVEEIKPLIKRYPERLLPPGMNEKDIDNDMFVPYVLLNFEKLRLERQVQRLQDQVEHR